MNTRVLEYLTAELDLIKANEEYFLHIFHYDEDMLLLENFAFSEDSVVYHAYTRDYQHHICSISYKEYNQFKELLNV